MATAAANTRSYGQCCGLALSLDLLGERWTLLIIRELARGPKRFGELIEGLDGIGTNLLSSRLKSLEAAGVIEPITLPPPARVAAYDLTTRGRDLLAPVEELGLWGFEMVPDAQKAGLTSRPAWAAMTMKARMDRAETDPPDGIFAFEAGREQFWLRVADGGSVLSDGVPPFKPDIRVEVDREGFFAIASGAQTPRRAGARIEGDPEALEVLLRTFRLPPVPVH